MTQNPLTGYAPVNGLELYYEVHGSGPALLLLHGGMTTIGDFALLLPTLAQSHQVIAYERQGHGHTADIDRPMTLSNDADDLAALLRHLKIDKADIFGYSTGGTVALGFALRYPQMVRKLVLLSAIYNEAGYTPEMMAGLRHATAEAMPPIMREMYEQVAPRPQDWPQLVARSVEAAAAFKGWKPDELRALNIPTLIAVGDGDIVRTEHAVEMFRLIPDARLAILPSTDHIGILFQRAEWLASMTEDFLTELAN
jgi:pimeloyl-ACP methyl ester carboxylesterase